MKTLDHTMKRMELRTNLHAVAEQNKKNQVNVEERMKLIEARQWESLQRDQSIQRNIHMLPSLRGQSR